MLLRNINTTLSKCICQEKSEQVFKSQNSNAESLKGTDKDVTEVII